MSSIIHEKKRKREHAAKTKTRPQGTQGPNMTLDEYKQHDPGDLMYFVDDDCRISTTTKNSHKSMYGNTSEGREEVIVLLKSPERNHKKIMFQACLSIKLLYQTKNDAIRKIEADYLKGAGTTYNFDTMRQWINEFKYLESARERIAASDGGGAGALGGGWGSMVIVVDFKVPAKQSAADVHPRSGW